MSIKSAALMYRKQLLNVDKVSLKSKQAEILNFINLVTLAPSTHNTQPWKFIIKDKKYVTVEFDLDKKVPEADQNNRDLAISLGALLRNIEILGNLTKFTSSLDIKPDLKSKHCATFKFLGHANWDSLADNLRFKALVMRQNYRGNFKENNFDKEALIKILSDSNKLSQLVEIKFTAKTNKIKEVAKLTAEGIKGAYSNEKFRKEIASYLNSNLSKKKTGLHGYSLNMNTFLSIIIPRIIRRFNVGSKLAELNSSSILSAGTVVLLSAKTDTIAAQVDVGRILQNIQIQLQEIGLTTSIYAAAVEIGDLHKSIEKIFETKKRSQILFTVGKAESSFGYSLRQNSASITTFR